ncbi:unnamed protein product [Brachionus calyciflorus]|uniref:Intraflagellar transport 43 n=1 Tax=Brachionus calyciflorus TaxID=104777 RepID=A0A814H4D5_9BILA|nr:unnamed protein product [Brachionus calyciflorus]
MTDQDIDFDLDGIKSARKSTSRRRRDLTDEDNLDMDIDPSVSSRSQIRRGSKTREGLNLENMPEQNNQSKPIAWGDSETDVSQSQNLRPRRRDVESNFSVDLGTSQDVSDSKAFSRKLNLKDMNQNEENEIPEIPDLEETADQADDLAFQIAEAPDVQVHQIATYKELDKEFFKEKAFQFLEGNIDVSLLHCGLSTELQIAEEEDIIWEWNKLFTEVVSVLTANNENDKKFTFDQPNEILNKSPADTQTGNQTSRRERKLDF